MFEIVRVLRLARLHVGEFGGDGLSRNDAAGAADHRDGRRIVARAMALIGRRAIFGRLVEGVIDILHADRQAAQRQRAQRVFILARMNTRALDVEMRERADVVLLRGNGRGAQVNDAIGRKLTGLDPAREIEGGLEAVRTREHCWNPRFPRSVARMAAKRNRRVFLADKIMQDRQREEKGRSVFDLGTSFRASVARDPNALAIVDGECGSPMREWYRRISALVAGFDRLGLKPGDHLVTALQNTLAGRDHPLGLPVRRHHHHAAELARDRSRLDYCLRQCRGRRRWSTRTCRRDGRAGLPRPAATVGVERCDDFTSNLADGQGARRAARASDAEAWSVMLYTSGTTAKPKGVPRRQRAERAAALAHVAQNLYRAGERTLGVMPLYHTMGVRSLLAMSLIGGAFVCLPRFDAGRALELIERERITNLYLVPTLYHDLLHHPRFARDRRQRRCASSASPARR